MRGNTINIGDVYINHLGEQFEIVEHLGIRNKQNDYIIKFTETENYQITAGSVINGLRVRDLSKPCICEVGYIKGSKSNPARSYVGNSFQRWQQMMTRCYQSTDRRNKAYKDATVCEEWHNYSNFKRWYDKNFPVTDNLNRKLVYDASISLDKDLFRKNGEKIYSPETCCFIPKELNSFITGLKLNNGIPQKTSAKKVYTLRCLLDKYKCLLSDKVYELLDNYASEYIRTFNKENRMNFMKMFGEAIAEKPDLSKLKVNALIDFEGQLMKFNKISDLQEFIGGIERRELLKKQT